MKRIALLFVCGALVASAQEVRITRAALLKSERSIISLRPGTMVDLLSRDEQTLTVRFNSHTGTIPANSLTPVEKQQPVETKPSAPVKKTGSQFVNAVTKAKENAGSHDQNNAQQVNTILAVN